MKQLAINDLLKKPCRWSRVSLGINNTVAGKIKPIILSHDLAMLSQYPAKQRKNENRLEIIRNIRKIFLINPDREDTELLNKSGKKIIIFSFSSTNMQSLDSFLEKDSQVYVFEIEDNQQAPKYFNLLGKALLNFTLQRFSQDTALSQNIIYLNWEKISWLSMDWVYLANQCNRYGTSIILSSNLEAMAQCKKEACEYLLYSLPIWIDSDKMSSKLVLKDISKEEVTALNIEHMTKNELKK